MKKIIRYILIQIILTHNVNFSHNMVMIVDYNIFFSEFYHLYRSCGINNIGMSADNIHCFVYNVKLF